jgi:ADP-heptose:LPS heptosyltransferase
MASQGKKLVSVIVLAETAPFEAVNETIQNILNQTYKMLDIVVSADKKRPDMKALRDQWNSTPNLRILETDGGIALIQEAIKIANGEFIFYKSVGPIGWLPRHIEHHLDLFRWDSKALWSFSFLEYKDITQQQNPINVINWRIESAPDPKKIIADELCHLTEFKPDWNKMMVSFDEGKSITFFPGACLEAWKSYRVAVPEEITVQQWIDPHPPVPTFGMPVSDEPVVEDVVEELDGQLGVRVELPTLVGSTQWDAHNKIVLNRLRDILPEKITKIAVKRTIGMGDVILVEPIIRNLRKRYSNAEITLFTSKNRSCVDIVKQFVSKPDHVIGMDGEGEIVKDYLYTQKGYDLRIDLDLSYECRKNINYIDAYFLTAGFTDEIVEVDGLLQVQNPVPDEERVPALIYEEPRTIPEKFVAVELAGSGWAGKEWDLESWDKVLETIFKMGYKIVFVSPQRLPKGENYTSNVNTHSEFGAMMRDLRCCEFYIGADNGPMHVAAGLGKKCFVVAGAAIPAYTSKSKNIWQVTNPTLSCLHCKGRQYYNQLENGQLTFVARCDIPDQYACMKKLDLQYVLDQFNQFHTQFTIKGE